MGVLALSFLFAPAAVPLLAAPFTPLAAAFALLALALMLALMPFLTFWPRATTFFFAGGALSSDDDDSSPDDDSPEDDESPEAESSSWASPAVLLEVLSWVLSPLGRFFCCLARAEDLRALGPQKYLQLACTNLTE